MKWWHWFGALVVVAACAFMVSHHYEARVAERFDGDLERAAVAYQAGLHSPVRETDAEESLRYGSIVVAIGAGGLAALLAGWKVLLYAVREMGRAARDVPKA